MMKKQLKQPNDESTVLYILNIWERRASVGCLLGRLAFRWRYAIVKYFEKKSSSQVSHVPPMES